jgi:hypothetical protein
VSDTNRAGVLFYFDTEPGTGAGFKYSLSEGTTNFSGVITSLATERPPDIYTVIDAILRGLFNIDIGPYIAPPIAYLDSVGKI